MTTWTNLSAAFGYGTKLTSSQMQQLRDNITALAEQATGAPTLVVDTAQLVNGAVTNDKLGADAVNGSKIADGAVDTEHLAASAVEEAKIANSAVTTNKLASGERMTAANVDGAIAGSSVGAVGTYALLLWSTTGTSKSAGDTISSGLSFADVAGNASGAASGTWMLCGYIDGDAGDPKARTSLFLRVS